MNDGVVEMYTQEDYLKETLNYCGRENAKPVVAPGVVTTKMPHGVSLPDESMPHHYRTGVGKCMWLVPLIPDIYYTVKELARHLQAPTMEQFQRLSTC